MTDLSSSLQLNDLRLRVLNKQDVSPEEMRLLLDNLREGRSKALREEKSATRKAKASLKKPQSEQIDLDKLFS